jgi:multimeric flavodoxin WrbA
MKSIILHGSPRKGKNSDTLAESFIKGLIEEKPWQVTHFYLNEMEISPCQGCLTCAKSPHMCRFDDDMQQIYLAYKESDLVVWTTPMYWGYLTAQMKLVQDRMEALAWEEFGNKTFVALFTYRHHFESAENMFRRIAPYFKIDLHVLDCCTYEKETGRDISINMLPEKLEEAYLLGKLLSNLQWSNQRVR